jgi:hypothetical protein
MAQFLLAAVRSFFDGRPVGTARRETTAQSSKVLMSSCREGVLESLRALSFTANPTALAGLQIVASGENWTRGVVASARTRYGEGQVIGDFKTSEQNAGGRKLANGFRGEKISPAGELGTEPSVID